ncbi:MAG: 3-keto-disaccharide hydrolase [Flavobacteriaceae bacterium]
MKKQLLIITGLIVFASCQGTAQKKKEDNTTAKVEQTTQSDQEWISLFDGKTLNGWHQYNGDAIGEEWSVKDGVMTFEPKENRQWGDGGKNIVTDQEFTSFVLSIEWNVSEAGNSGIFWGVQEGEEYGEPYVTGPEIQILDNERHPDAKANPKFHQAGALYDLVQPKADVCNPAGEWNHVLLTVDHNINEGNVVFNGTEIVRFPLSGDAWDELVNNSKFKGWKGFGEFKTGKIGLQDHDDKVSFRNIKIKVL